MISIPGIRLGLQNDFKIDTQKCQQIADTLQGLDTLLNNMLRSPDGWPTEAETICHIIVPLFRSLGWPDTHMKLEYPCRKRDKLSKGVIDLACFHEGLTVKHQPNTLPTRGTVILEAKAPGIGLAIAKDQARQYSQVFSDCDKLVLSNGIQFKLFIRNNDTFDIENPSAYLNIRRPTRTYPFSTTSRTSGGAVEFLKALIF